MCGVHNVPIELVRTEDGVGAAWPFSPLPLPKDCQGDGILGESSGVVAECQSISHGDDWPAV